MNEKLLDKQYSIWYNEYEVKKLKTKKEKENENHETRIKEQGLYR